MTLNYVVVSASQPGRTSVGVHEVVGLQNLHEISGIMRSHLVGSASAPLSCREGPPASRHRATSTTVRTGEIRCPSVGTSRVRHRGGLVTADGEIAVYAHPYLDLEARERRRGAGPARTHRRHPRLRGPRGGTGYDPPTLSYSTGHRSRLRRGRSGCVASGSRSWPGEQVPVYDPVRSVVEPRRPPISRHSAP